MGKYIISLILGLTFTIFANATDMDDLDALMGDLEGDSAAVSDFDNPMCDAIDGETLVSCAYGNGNFLDIFSDDRLTDVIRKSLQEAQTVLVSKQNVSEIVFRVNPATAKSEQDPHCEAKAADDETLQIMGIDTGGEATKTHLFADMQAIQSFFEQLPKSSEINTWCDKACSVGYKTNIVPIEEGYLVETEASCGLERDKANFNYYKVSTSVK